MSDSDLLAAVDMLRDLMVSVATGGPKIDEVNEQYRALYTKVNAELRRRGIPNPNPHSDLWQWYGRWSLGLATWASRREYVADLFQSLLKRIETGVGQPKPQMPEPTGWSRVDRCVYEIRHQLERAENEEQFQSVGLLCREALISVAQEVYDPFFHDTEDGVSPSRTDAKRMMDAFLAFELEGGSNQAARKLAKAALGLSLDLQHHRTATGLQASLCAEATVFVVNIAAIISGRRGQKG